MDDGILLLRLILAALVAGHGAQKLLGWFGGGGIQGTTPLFASWGLQPARLMVAVAGGLELIGSALIAAGAATILGSCIVFGTMLVASAVTWKKGLWAAKGGFELPLVYGLVALAIGATGPGDYSVDQVIGLLNFSGINFAIGAAAIAALGAAPLLLRIARATKTSA
ncbi:DoxX family protein [Arthrobacter sp. B2a2-09]|uniref:DoxX family protein n=1 Tax=Arthrobacter sp. B2a2-09 TaxID=2952822 RepID=UPI0022CD9D54|nr:DoxX family protein [Arthrobacter sp. B2a2-09]MCZ9880227.1 DoxX family protein [Arthrobacter sp. B2a2-09]